MITRPRTSRGAFSLVEAVAASLILAIAVVAALRTAGASRVAQYKDAERATARQLGDDLMAEIMSKPYVDPNYTSSSGGGTSGLLGDLLGTVGNLLGGLLGGGSSAPAVSFGPEQGETTLPVSRSKFNDVDDYAGWSETPPQDPAGTAIPNLTGWKRTVSVVWIDPNTMARAATETGAKLITITVVHNKATILTRVAVRTAAP